MIVRTPPVFTAQHARAMVDEARSIEPPALICAFDRESTMLAVAALTDVGLVHWTITGPNASNVYVHIIQKFKAQFELDDDGVHIFEFQGSNVVPFHGDLDSIG